MQRLLFRLRGANREQRQAIMSVAMSFLTRLPGLVGLLWFLPLVRFGLGTDDYADLLSAIALGTAASFCSGGIAMIGRRRIGEAYANGDHHGEAIGFSSFALAHAMTIGLALVIVTLYCRLSGSSASYQLVALLTTGGTFFITFDNTRAAYNEHYITASLLLVCQIVAFTIGLTVAVTRQNMVLSLLVMQTPYWLANCATFGLILRARPYLLHGRPTATGAVLRRGSMLAMADGFLMATLSLAVVWLQSHATIDIAAWFATLARLFQTLLAPLVVVLFSVSSYIRIIWNRKALAQQKTFTKIMLMFVFGYGAVVSVSLYALSQVYIGWLLHIPAPNDLLVFILFGAIISYNGYSSIAYAVLDETVHLSSGITAAVGLAVLLGAAISRHVDPLSAVNVYAVVAGVSILGVISWNAMRFILQPSESARL